MLADVKGQCELSLLRRERTFEFGALSFVQEQSKFPLFKGFLGSAFSSACL